MALTPPWTSLPYGSISLCVWPQKIHIKAYAGIRKKKKRNFTHLGATPSPSVPGYCTALSTTVLGTAESGRQGYCLPSPGGRTPRQAARLCVTDHTMVHSPFTPRGRQPVVNIVAVFRGCHRFESLTMRCCRPRLARYSSHTL